MPSLLSRSAGGGSCVGRGCHLGVSRDGERQPLPMPEELMADQGVHRLGHPVAGVVKNDIVKLFDTIKSYGVT
ncbi:hypothetical protein GUJ93_ZPchr0004g38787 [Zizania palustris]|uniref:Uncharacterized protein n=1 Tax=Zizania palustris TaxID=103762 RepID=A0A8J5VFP0_ZIZPA|nr:hypothetical protein GUJ93_ZPchr0004g38787 [Zizania palustris]